MTQTLGMLSLGNMLYPEPPRQTALGGLLMSSVSPHTGLMWEYVTRRFRTFQSNLSITDRQAQDAVTKFKGLTSTLNTAYRNDNSDSANAFVIGSWAKDTHIRPPRDVDMYYVLPIDVYHRFEAYSHGANKQSAILQEVKRKLMNSYHNSEIRGDGPVVLADFYGWTVEIVPAFYIPGTDRNFLVCDTRDGGRYIKTMPFHEVDHIEAAEKRVNNNVRPLIRMLKCWQAYCNVEIKSFHLELLAVEFLDSWQHKHQDLFYYDWMCRDFFLWIITKANKFVWAPGTFELLWLGDSWKSRAESAYARAVKAADFERENKLVEAGEEWQKIFGTDMPRYA
jgi:hypothetical protein